MCFVASDEKPFRAIVREKGEIFSMIYNNTGIKEESQDKGSEIRKTKTVKLKDDPLAILKLRLAKGEITNKEFEDLKKIIE